MRINTQSYIEYGYHLIGAQAGIADITPSLVEMIGERAVEIRREFLHYNDLAEDTGSDWIVALTETAQSVLAAHLAINDLLHKTIGAVEAEWIMPNFSRHALHGISDILIGDLIDTEQIYMFYD